MTNKELYQNIDYYAQIFMKARDKDMRELGTLLTDAYNRLVESDNLLAESREKIQIFAQAGISENMKPTELVEMVRKQNEILQEYVGLASVLAENRAEREINESIEAKLKGTALQIINRLLSAKDSRAKLDAVGGLIVLLLDPSFASRALKVARAGGGDDYV